MARNSADPFLSKYRTTFGADRASKRDAEPKTLRQAQVRDLPPSWRVPVKAKPAPQKPKPSAKDYAATAANVFFGDPRDLWSMYGDIGSAARDYLSNTTPSEMASAAVDALKAEGRALRAAPVGESLNLLKAGFIDPLTAPFDVAAEAAQLRAEGNEEGARRLASLAVPLAALSAPGLGVSARAPRQALREGASGAARGSAERAARPATVNIGLEPSTRIGGLPVSPVEALTRLEVGLGRRPTNIRRVFSQSEPTLVADLDEALKPREAHKLSKQLRQDAIAQHLGGGEGLISGPAAADWGKFNPAYFYTQSGDTLSSDMLTDLFRSGAPREDVMALAEKYGFNPDPVALDISMRMRDEAEGPLPEQLGRFTSRETRNSPEELRAYREAERRLLERQIAERGREEFQLRRLVPSLEQLPPEEELLRAMREAQLPRIGPAPGRTEVGGRGVHISRSEGLSELDPSFFGKGHRGEEYARTKREKLPNRSYLYVGPEGTVSAEPAVLGVSGGEMRSGPRYAYESDLSGLYDINADPESIRALAQAYQLPDYKPQLPEWAVGNKLIPGSLRLEGDRPSADLERWIKQRGYKGYLSDFGGGRAAAMYEPVKVRPIDEEPIADWRRKFAVGGRV